MCVRVCWSSLTEDRRGGRLGTFATVSHEQKKIESDLQKMASLPAVKQDLRRRSRMGI